VPKWKFHPFKLFEGESIMSNVTLLAIDLAKNIFQLHGTDVHGKAIVNKRIKSRDQLSQFVANLNPCNIYMEGCGSANYWGRKFITFGHQVKLINPKYVKPYVMGNKNDKNDAIAIAKAARDPAMRFGEVKLQQQQDVQSTHRVRSHFVSERTALANMIRGVLAEYGIVVAKGVSNIRKLLPIILENNEYNLNGDMLMNVRILYSSLTSLDEVVEKYNVMIEKLFEKNEVCGRLEKIPGVGKIGATILAAALGNGSAFNPTLGLC
jgi:transposase